MSGSGCRVVVGRLHGRIPNRISGMLFGDRAGGQDVGDLRVGERDVPLLDRGGQTSERKKK